MQPRTLAQVSICPIRRPVSCRRQLRALHRIALYREKETGNRVQVTYSAAPSATSPACPATASTSRYAACVTAAQLTPSASRSTPQPTTATKTSSCAPDSPPAPARSPRLPPVRSTSSGGPATNQSHDPDPSPGELTGSATSRPAGGADESPASDHKDLFGVL